MKSYGTLVGELPTGIEFVVEGALAGDPVSELYQLPFSGLQLFFNFVLHILFILHHSIQ